MAVLTEKKATLVLTTHHDLNSLKPTKKTQRFGPIRAALTADNAEAGPFSGPRGGRSTMVDFRH